jgi:hypothetical protein
MKSILVVILGFPWKVMLILILLMFAFRMNEVHYSVLGLNINAV